VKQGDKILEYPYMCDPTDYDSKCRYEYNVTKWNGDPKTPAKIAYFEYPCQCSLDGDTGYCGTVLGTKTFQEGAAKIKNLISQS